MGYYIYSNYAWVVLLKSKNDTTVTNVFQNLLDESGRKPNKIWVDQSNDFYNRSSKSQLHENCIEMYSTHNEEISIFHQRFIRTLKKQIYMDMTAT